MHDVVRCVLCGLVAGSSWPSKCMLNGNGDHVDPLADRKFLEAVYRYRQPVISVAAVNELRANGQRYWGVDGGAIAP